MTVASYDRKLGRYHDPELAPATHARNRAATKQYWAALVSTASFQLEILQRTFPFVRALFR